MRQFIGRLRERGQLTEIRESVSPEFEAAKLARELRKPLLFHDIRGFKVAMNILQSRSLLSDALGIAENDIVKHLASLTPDGEVTLVDDSPTMEVDSAPDLEKLPVLMHYPKDRGAYMTAGIIVSEFEGVMNASVHRLLVLGKNRLAGRLVEQRHTYELHKKASEKGEPLPVAIVIGASPAVMLASTTRLPPGREFQYASAIAGKPV
ncbi:MAG TPA: UbiD family decarboxylase, partial [Candidatus Methanoperedenaceae archaeon]|nr:UbiD family decarboxylase [Candidatus Methanoperedenaceae archaeon]